MTQEAVVLMKDITKVFPELLLFKMLLFQLKKLR